MTKQDSILIIVFQFLFTFCSYAQGNVCAADVAKLCKGVTSGNRQIAKCLKNNNDHVSSPCAELAMQIRQEKKILRQLCYRDVKATCSSVVPGQNRVYNCLIENSQLVSSACNNKLAEVMRLVILK